MESTHSDVIVIGAGLSGLCAAEKLVAAGKSVKVLEANSRTGGRIQSLSIPLANATPSFDMGAAYIGSTQDALIELARSLDIEVTKSGSGENAELSGAVIPTYNKGKMVLYWNGKRNLSNPDTTIPIAGFGPMAVMDIVDLFNNQVMPHVQELLDLKTKPKKWPKGEPFVSLDVITCPWKAPMAKEWDQLSVEDWLASMRVIDEDAKDLIRTAVNCVWSANANEISLLYFFWYMACAGTMDQLLNCHGNGAQAYRFKDGADNITNRLTKRLGDNIEIDQAVHSIDTSQALVSVSTVNGAVYTCDKVVIAMSPFMSSRINYNPPLPDARASLLQRMPIGRTIKCIATYDTPFWREADSNDPESKPLCGMAISNSTDPVWFMDDTTKDGCNAMMGFVVADNATKFSQLKDADARKKAITDSFVKVFGREEFASPTGYVEKDWNAEPWAWGCPVGMMAPGALTQFGFALREPVGAIHWAGTETATEWQGYMNGAIQAGHRCAKEILDS